jgi:hypothetical protein
MKNILLNCGKSHQQYRIVAEYNSINTSLALAGFCAEEHTENMLLGIYKIFVYKAMEA